MQFSELADGKHLTISRTSPRATRQGSRMRRTPAGWKKRPSSPARGRGTAREKRRGGGGGRGVIARARDVPPGAPPYTACGGPPPPLARGRIARCRADGPERDLSRPRDTISAEGSGRRELHQLDRLRIGDRPADPPRRVEVDVGLAEKGSRRIAVSSRSAMR